MKKVPEPPKNTATPPSGDSTIQDSEWAQDAEPESGWLRDLVEDEVESPPIPANALVGDRFRVVQCVAEGGMGRVYLALDEVPAASGRTD